jgi:hypothetical protein
MFLKQYYLGCLAHASYLLGDEETGTDIIVDPQPDSEQYLHDAIVTADRPDAPDYALFPLFYSFRYFRVK